MTRLLVILLLVLLAIGTTGLGALYLVGAYREQDRVLLVLGVFKLAMVAAFVVGLTGNRCRSTHSAWPCC